VTGTIAVEDFRDLASWKQARFVVCALLAFTESLARSAESKRFASDIDRLSISILDNMAKGYEGEGDRTFLVKARESIDLLETQLQRALEKEVLSASDSVRLARELDEVKRSLKEY
jgi:four helix bundle protein